MNQPKTHQRSLSPYEKNHLRQYGFDPENIDQYGQQPVEYITGKTNFLGQEFTITPEVLIPRIETEELVNHIQQDYLQGLLSSPSSLHLVEVGVGSGVIGLSLLRFFIDQRQPIKLTLIDIDKKALVVAKKNYQQLFSSLPISTKVTFLLGDLLSAYDQSQEIDLLVANLPYIPSSRVKNLDVSVREFEPRLALDGGKDGLRYISPLFSQAKSVLKPTGRGYLEIDDTHTTEKLQSLTADYQITVFSDQFGKNRLATFQLT